MKIKHFRLLVVSSILIFMIATVTLFGQMKVNQLMCDNSEAQEMIIKVCYDYSYVLATGDLCYDLCRTKTIEYKTCLNRKRGKHVFLMNYGGHDVILKSKFTRMNEILPALHIRSPSKHPVAPGVRSLMAEFEDSTLQKWEFPVAPVQSGKEGGVIDFINMAVFERHSIAAENTMWSLLQQEEYVMLRYLQDRLNVPKLHGSCGHFYLVEYTPPWQDRDLWTWLGMPRNSGWETRVNISLQLLDTVKVLSQDLEQELHMCDVKLQNFGLDSQGLVKLIDVDYILFDSSLRMRTEMRKCKDHDECDENDCKGWCDIAKGVCHNGRKNNNFQSVCQKIFSSEWTNDLTGLLRAPPDTLAEELDSVLQRCSNPPPTLPLLPGCFSTAHGNVVCPFKRKKVNPLVSTKDRSRKFAASDQDFQHLYTLLKKEQRRLLGDVSGVKSNV